MNRECAICNETKILNTCRAFNNCNAVVCSSCKVKASPSASVCSPCLFCFTYDYYERIGMELECDVFNCSSESSDIYVILKQQMKGFVCDEDFYNDYDFCYDCDDDAQ
tara:strand:- start:37 stop:360 length:324 start_codon:yes stop_codon:yes gene_type:complete